MLIFEALLLISCARHRLARRVGRVSILPFPAFPLATGRVCIGKKLEAIAISDYVYVKTVRLDCAVVSPLPSQATYITQTGTCIFANWMFAMSSSSLTTSPNINSSSSCLFLLSLMSEYKSEIRCSKAVSCKKVLMPSRTTLGGQPCGFPNAYSQVSVH